MLLEMYNCAPPLKISSADASCAQTFCHASSSNIARQGAQPPARHEREKTGNRLETARTE
jgi:hypothetical protein